MTSRQTGRKISQIYGGRTGARAMGRTGSRQKKDQMSGTEKLRLIQFLVCGTIFVTLVAVKLLLPEQIGQLSRQVSGFLERNMDVTEVFSAVGRAFTGEGADGWGDLYQAVFHPGEPAAVETGAALGRPVSDAALRTLDSRDGWLKGPTMDPVDPQAGASEPNGVSAPEGEGAGAPEETDTGTAEVRNLSYILYSDQTLPDNVSLEQRVLGFDYCTPVLGVLSSDFGYREHPIEGNERFHYGLDIAANEGTDVGCFADGTVTAVGESSSYGKYVIVAHAGNFSTLYAHCSKITASSGAAVKEGQKIAEVGQTGEATGPHLHFEVHAGNTYLDPIYYVSLA